MRTIKIIDLDVEDDRAIKIPDHSDPPERSLGSDINTIHDAKKWLLHPSNWIESQLFIIKWDGIVPKIDKNRALYLISNPDDVALFISVISQQKRMKMRSEDEQAECDSLPFEEE